MTVNRPEADLPRGLRGGSDTWDTGPAGVVLRDDWFQTAAGSATGALAATETGSDTFSASGVVSDAPRSGSLAATETGSDTIEASGTSAGGGGGGAPITFTSHGPYDNQPGAGATATSGSISYTAGQPIIVEAGSSDTLTISDTTGLTWQLLDVSLPLYFAANQEYQYVWYAIPASSGSTTITVTRASSGSYFGFLASTYQNGAGTPLLKSTGSVGSYTASATAFSNTITPTTSGSAVWTSYFTGGGGGPPTLDSGSAIYTGLTIAGNRTHYRLGKETEPLTSSAAVTISGQTDTGFQYAQWINYEVPATGGGGGGGATGTLNASELGSDTFAGTGSLTPLASTGSLAAIEAASDNAALTGAVLVQGALTVVEAVTDSATLAGTVLAQGALAVVEVGSDTFAGTGSLTPLAGTGSLTVTEVGSDSAALTGAVLVQGALVVSEVGADSAALTGAVFVQGSLVVSEAGSDSASLAGVVLVQGALTVVESGVDTFAGTGSLTLLAGTGSLNVTETGTDTFAAAGKVTVSGALAVSETGSDAIAASGVLLVQGSLAATESGSDTAALSGALRVQGALSATESGSDTITASGTTTANGPTGTLTATESGSDSAVMSGKALILGMFAAAESGSDSAAATGVVRVVGAVSCAEVALYDSMVAAGGILARGQMSVSESPSLDIAAIAGIAPLTPPFYMNARTAGGWVQGSLKRWDGVTWVNPVVKRWNGVDWL